MVIGVEGIHGARVEINSFLEFRVYIALSGVFDSLTSGVSRWCYDCWCCEPGLRQYARRPVSDRAIRPVNQCDLYC